MLFFEFQKYFGNVQAFPNSRKLRKFCEIFPKKIGKKFGNFESKLAKNGHFWLQKTSKLDQKWPFLTTKLVPTRNFWTFFKSGQVIPNFLFSRVSEIAVFQKLGSEWVFRAFSELVPTHENSFRLETWLKNSDKSSECRAFVKWPENEQQKKQRNCSLAKKKSFIWSATVLSVNWDKIMNIL